MVDGSLMFKLYTGMFGASSNSSVYNVSIPKVPYAMFICTTASTDSVGEYAALGYMNMIVGNEYWYEGFTSNKYSITSAYLQSYPGTMYEGRKSILSKMGTMQINTGRYLFYPTSLNATTSGLAVDVSSTAVEFKYGSVTIGSNSFSYRSTTDCYGYFAYAIIC